MNQYTQMDPSVVFLAIAGWLGSNWISYRLGLHSQKLQREHAAQSSLQNRRREFLAFLQAWRVEIDRRHLEAGGFARDPAAYADRVSGFRAAAEIVRGDFTDLS